MSYDSLYFRRIDMNRALVGGGKTDNVLIAVDPYKSDDRDGARTHIAWDGGAYAIFTIIGGRLFFTRVSDVGSVLVPLKELGPAFSQHFSGQFSFVHKNGAYFVSHSKVSFDGVDIMKVSQTGQVLATAPVTGGDVRFSQVFEKNGLIYVLANDASDSAVVTVFNEDLAPQPGTSGALGNSPMYHPAMAQDPATGNIGMVYLDAKWSGSVMFQRLLTGP